MAKTSRNKNFIFSSSNTMEENKKMLNIFRNKYQTNKRNYEDYEKLFVKLNQTNGSNLDETTQYSSSHWRNKNMENFTYGPISGFKPGAWWGIRMDCSRDLVHSPFDTDMQVGPSGVTSICTSNVNVKEDVDFGEYLTLTGEPYLENSQRTDPFIVNYKNQVPFRLIRSYNLLNKYAPKTGYRYDGLYIVIGHWIAKNSDSVMYNKFALKRIGDNEILPWQVTNTDDNNINNETRSQTLENRPRCLLKVIDKCRKYSYHTDKSSKSLMNTLKVNAVQNIPDSTIVTRKEFKKVNNNIENVNTSKIQTHSDTQGDETRSTDISIRTDLYDSSHNLQDVKRTTMMCCRPTRISTYNALHKNVPRHLNVLQHYKMKSGSYSMLRPKTSSTDGSTEKRLPHKDQKPSEIKQESNGYKKSILEQKNPTDKLQFKKGTENIVSISKKDSTSSLNNKRLSETPNIKTDVLKISNDKINDINDNDSTEIQKAKVPVMESTENSFKHNMNAEKQAELESLKSLTPDKILSLIDKKKCHPMSKLLIGDIIGFMPQESMILKTRNNVSYSVTKSNIDTESKKQNNNRKNVVKSKMNRQSGSREHINRKRRFSKSSIEKHTQKKMREITNLLIDAKVEPIKRGPRNRRLRFTNKVQNKKYNTLHAIIDARRKSKVTKVKRQTREIKHKVSDLKSGGNRINLRSITNNNDNNVKNKSLEVQLNKRTKQSNSEISEEKNHFEKSLQYSCNNRYDVKPCTSDATTQCFFPYNAPNKGLFTKASVCNNSSIHNVENRRTFVEVQLTSENCTDFSSCKLCPIHVRVSHTQNDNENAVHYVNQCMDSVSDEPRIDNSCKQELSAFSSINRADNDTSVAHRKPVHFKPIIKHFSFNDLHHEVCANNDLKQSILRKRNKYTNTEDNVAMYLDEESQYPNMNGEDKLRIVKESSILNIPDQKSSMEEVHRHLLSEEDSDLPWHGWKQIVTDKRLYWIGW